MYFTDKKKSFDAVGKQTEEGFAVLKGSKIAQNVAPSLPKSAIVLREEFHEQIPNHVLFSDLPFTSASTAAAFVAGYSVNGKTAWKNRGGKTLQEIEQREVLPPA